MVDLAKNFDGTLEGAISATSKLNGTWAPLQKFITFGDFGSGISKKIDGTNFEKDSNGTNIQNYVSQIANLDKTQQDAIISATKFDKKKIMMYAKPLRIFLMRLQTSPVSTLAPLNPL